MGERAAGELLGVDPERVDEDGLQDAYESACFQVRQKALMNISVPRLMKKRFESLERILEAFRSLGGEEEGEIPRPSCDAMLDFEDASELLGTPPPWSPCIRHYEERIRPAQLEVANSFTAVPLAKGIERILFEQQAYHSVLYQAFEPLFLDPEHYPLSHGRMNKEVKASQNEYSATLLEDFRSLEEDGLGARGIGPVSEELERELEKGRWEVESALDRILTEAYRIHQLRSLDKKQG
jgi:hypothetical protein